MRQVFQTDGDPPRRGRTSFAKRGSTQKRRREEERAEREKRASREQPCRGGAKTPSKQNYAFFSSNGATAVSRRTAVCAVINEKKP